MHPIMINPHTKKAKLTAPETEAGLIVRLLQSALRAPVVAEAVKPMLQTLTQRTSAAGAAYFQAKGDVFVARSSSGVMPSGPIMDEILTHGLPNDTRLLRLLQTQSQALFFNDTSYAPVTADFHMLGVASLAAAPVHAADGTFLGAFLMHTFEHHTWNTSERQLFSAVSGIMANLTARLVAEEQTTQSYEEALRALGLALEFRDAETKGHTDRVTALALKMAHALHLSAEDITALRWGAYLHDIGKIGTPDNILHKRGPLDAAEWHTMQQHPEVGAAFAKHLSFLPPLTRACIEAHHERWNGKGYPAGLAGEAIPISARIFAICDVYDALTSERPYKTAWTHEAALQEITAQAGAHFDPDLVAVFVRLFPA